MAFVVHTLKYEGNRLSSPLKLRNYRREDLKAYTQNYEKCFHEMRKALDVSPVYYCKSEQHLLENSENIYILSHGDTLIGSIAIYGNEIDDLFVTEEYQTLNYGKALLQFAIASMQKNGVYPICLHVADWNQIAMKMYLSFGFRVIETEMIK